MYHMLISCVSKSPVHKNVVSYYSIAFCSYMAKQQSRLFIFGPTLKYSVCCALLVITQTVLCCQMAIIFNESGLADVEPPCVVQSFVNHNARLFKVFIVGPRHFVVQRPSIRNCYAGGLHSFVLCFF